MLMIFVALKFVATYLTITKLDKVNRILSGTFEFAQVKQCYDEVRITDGRFDVRY